MRKHITEIMQEQGITSADLASKTGLNPRVIARTLETHDCNLDVFMKIVEVLNVDVDGVEL